MVRPVMGNVVDHTAREFCDNGDADEDQKRRTEKHPIVETPNLAVGRGAADRDDAEARGGQEKDTASR